MQKTNTPKILNYKNLNREKYEYLIPHKTPAGNYQSICNYRLSKNELSPFYIETPKLRTTSGIVRIDNKFYMDLSALQLLQQIYVILSIFFISVLPDLQELHNTYCFI